MNTKTKIDPELVVGYYVPCKGEGWKAYNIVLVPIGAKIIDMVDPEMLMSKGAVRRIVERRNERGLDLNNR
jgi:hypothetical protein